MIKNFSKNNKIKDKGLSVLSMPVLVEYLLQVRQKLMKCDDKKSYLPVLFA